ncbi:MAG: HigA family addiction module antitoxin [Spirochaetia bacterium]|jgi:HTH-type transcriptional regulator/antitoxin HigA|nr:HigA family addiction module antitoxin [Spirochaetia bacterium]
MFDKLRPFYNPGPGDVIRDAMEELGWQQSDLADITGLTGKSINKIINNKQGITPETAILLGKAFSTPAELWLNLDAKYQLRKQETDTCGKEALAEKKAQMRKYMPVAELKKKGWLLYDVSTAKGIEQECQRLFGKPEIPTEEYNQEKKFAARQTRFDFQYTMWYCRTWFEYAKLYAPAAAPRQAYDREKLADLAGNFCMFLAAKDGIEKVLTALTDCGVGFFVLSHLTKTYLDGAAFLQDGKPFIVYTARYDRIDNFWFVLAHEISHILLHFDYLCEPVLDNLDSNAETKREQEADENASKMLNSKKVILLGQHYGKYLSADRLELISRESGVPITVALGILQHAKIIEWRQFSKYKEKVMNKIPVGMVKG